MRRIFMVIVLLVIGALMSGCGSLYPVDEIQANQIPDVDQLAAVQRAVNEFKADTAVLPIKTREADTDIFIKYLIDFEKLVPQYLANIPSNAYEKGGIYQYIIWDAEHNPTVKLVDLQMPERIREVNLRFTAAQYPQYKDKVADFIYTIDFKRIGYTESTTVKSPYSNNLLPLLVTTEGAVIVDYRIDLAKILQEKQIVAQPGEDIRRYLVEHYPVVPAYSVPYTVDKNQEPMFMFNPIEGKQ